MGNSEKDFGFSEKGKMKTIEYSEDIYSKCAQICESMVIGGRAWTVEQAIAADALLAAAKAIREAGKKVRK
jgi:hypothetical protein